MYSADPEEMPRYVSSGSSLFAKESVKEFPVIALCVERRYRQTFLDNFLAVKSRLLIS